MKKTIQVLALVLALGATVQAVKAYAVEAQVFSVEEEEYKIVRLIEMRKQISTLGVTSTPDADFPEVKDSADVNVSLVKHLVRYIFAIGAEQSLFDYLKGSDVKAACAASARCGSEPGI